VEGSTCAHSRPYRKGVIDAAHELLSRCRRRPSNMKPIPLLPFPALLCAATCAVSGVLLLSTATRAAPPRSRTAGRRRGSFSGPRPRPNRCPPPLKVMVRRYGVATEFFSDSAPPPVPPPFIWRGTSTTGRATVAASFRAPVRHAPGRERRVVSVGDAVARGASVQIRVRGRGGATALDFRPGGFRHGRRREHRAGLRRDRPVARFRTAGPTATTASPFETRSRPQTPRCPGNSRRICPKNILSSRQPGAI